MIKRELTNTIIRLASGFRVIAILGPRQSGKTTLAKAIFSKYKYLSLEDIGTRENAEKDPKGFIATYSNEVGLIIDEFQYVPALLSYIQLKVDENPRPGYFILTGSQNFLMNKAITQSLAGRVAIVTLLPLSIPELKNGSILPSTIEHMVFKGSYPELYSNPNINAKDWFANYIRTYIERDVRELKNIDNLSSFIKFMKLCAARVGQVINLSSLAMDADIDVSTVKSWISVLEASYIIFFLQPYSTKFTRRLIKSPKLFFYDSGLASSLLGLESEESVQLSSYRGNLVESLIVSEIYKLYFNSNKLPRAYFLRDKMGHEIDCVLEKLEKLIPIEIKAKFTGTMALFDELKYWNKVAQEEKADMLPGLVVYAGETEKRSYGELLSWKDIGQISEII